MGLRSAVEVCRIMGVSGRWKPDLARVRMPWTLDGGTTGTALGGRGGASGVGGDCVGDDDAGGGGLRIQGGGRVRKRVLVGPSGNRGGSGWWRGDRISTRRSLVMGMR